MLHHVYFKTNGYFEALYVPTELSSLCKQNQRNIIHVNFTRTQKN